MLEFINKTFGIQNEISSPILISLIVFIIGGLSNVIFLSIINYLDRIQYRKSFANMIEEIVKKSQQQSKNISDFIKILQIEHVGNWPLKFTRITYLELIYMQDYQGIFKAYQARFRWLCNRPIRYKAFHRIYSFIELLKFVESSIIISFNEFMQLFVEYENRFNENLDELRKLNDIFLKPYRGKRISQDDFQDSDIFNYIVSRDKIIKEWESMDVEIRKHRTTIMKKVIDPLFDLNKNKSKIEGSADLNNLLHNIKYEFDQMENLITVNRKIFTNYFWNYNSSAKILLKSLKLMKK